MNVDQPSHERVRAEFDEMPGMTLDGAPGVAAVRTRRDVCRAVVDRLVRRRRYLRQDRSGAVTRVAR